MGAVQDHPRDAGARRAEVAERFLRDRSSRRRNPRPSRRGDRNGDGTRRSALRSYVPQLARELGATGSDRDQTAHGVGRARPSVPGAQAMSDILLQKRENGVLWLTLNRPERKNSISPELRDELLEALEEAKNEDE